MSSTLPPPSPQLICMPVKNYFDVLPKWYEKVLEQHNFISFYLHQSGTTKILFKIDELSLSGFCGVREDCQTITMRAMNLLLVSLTLLSSTFGQFRSGGFRPFGSSFRIQSTEQRVLLTMHNNNYIFSIYQCFRKPRSTRFLFLKYMQIVNVHL